MRLLSALVLVSMAVAGCAAPADDAPPATPAPSEAPRASDPVGLTHATPPPYGLTVTGFGEGEFVVRLQNDASEPVEVDPSSFVLVDGEGTRWNASAGNASDAFSHRSLAPGEAAEGRLEFGFEELVRPARLVFAHGDATATWLLHVSQFLVVIEPLDDTSFGQPIDLPANGTVAYRASGIEGEVDLCVIGDEAHESWHAGDGPQGYGCRANASADAEAAVLLPPGRFNVGMACLSTAEQCRFTVTVIATW